MCPSHILLSVPDVTLAAQKVRPRLGVAAIGGIYPSNSSYDIATKLIAKMAKRHASPRSSASDDQVFGDAERIKPTLKWPIRSYILRLNPNARPNQANGTRSNV